MPPRTRAIIQEALSRFSTRWKEFQATPKAGSAGLLEQTLQLIKEFDILSSYLYKLRAETPPGDPLRRRVEDFMADASQNLETLQVPPSARRERDLWIFQYRRIWRENLPLFGMSTLLFLISLFVGWQTATQNPALVPTIVPQGMMEDILDHKPWFQAIEKSPALDGLLIAWNNIKVGISCFVLAALFGVGGLALLIYNGLLFGAIMGFCYVNHFDDMLTGFVVGHGPLELTIIVAATFSGLLFGRVFFMRPYSLFRLRMSIAAGEAGILLSGILPWLCLAACIEVFVSPWPQFSFELKMLIGIGAALWFWLWTLWPSAPEPSLA